MTKAKLLLQEWIGKQGHEACWYYPEIFVQLCSLLGVDATPPINSLSLAAFDEGCKRFQQTLSLR